MNFFKKKAGTALVLLAGLLAGGSVTAAPITMDFEGLTALTKVNSYYDGGCTSGGILFRKCGGPDYGVVWDNATVGDDFAGLLVKNKATMTIADGFTGGLSFNFYNLNLLHNASVTVFSGENGQGNKLAQADLNPALPWDFLDLTFNGLAKSVVFGGTKGFVFGFDNVTLGLNAPTPVPEPAAIGVFGLGLLMMGAFVGLRRRYN
jgi:hypothetical protein